MSTLEGPLNVFSCLTHQLCRFLLLGQKFYKIWVPFPHLTCFWMLFIAQNFTFYVSLLRLTFEAKMLKKKIAMYLTFQMTKKIPAHCMNKSKNSLFKRFFFVQKVQVHSSLPFCRNHLPFPLVFGSFQAKSTNDCQVMSSNFLLIFAT